MAYTFGGAVTDNVQITGLGTTFGTNRVALLTCWIRPTTLTATRVVWASGATWRLAIDTTTSSLRLTGDFVTDGVFTFPAGLAVNTWTFIAVLVNIGTAPTMQVKAWTATETTGPVERTVTVVTAPTSTVTAGGSTMTIGNTSGGSLAFQGEIGGFVVMFDSANGTVPNTIASVNADGSTSQDEADRVRRSYVDPLWRGDILQFSGMGRLGGRGTLWPLQVAMSLDQFGSAWGVRPDSRGRSTITGASFSTRTPRCFDDQTNNFQRPGRSGFYLLRS